MTNVLLIILCVIGVFVLIFILALIKKLTSLEDRIDEVREDAAPLMERLRYGNTPFGFLLGLIFGGKEETDIDREFKEWKKEQKSLDKELEKQMKKEIKQYEREIRGK